MESNAADAPSRAEFALSSAGDPVVTVDTNCVITLWNNAVEMPFGHLATEAVGQTLALVVPAKFRPRHMAASMPLSTRELAHGGTRARVKALTSRANATPLAMTLGSIKNNKRKANAVAIFRRIAHPEIRMRVRSLRQCRVDVLRPPKDRPGQ
jgi:PAS domain S-box-containing protein